MMKYIFRNTKTRITAIAFLLLSSSLLTFAQDSLLVKGVVLTINDEPIVSAAVSIEGSMAMPVLTDEAGEFTVKVSIADKWIIVSPSSDYKIKRVYLNGRTSLQLYLTPADLFSGDDNLKVLDQFISRSNLVAAHTDLNVENIEHTPAMSVDQSFQGVVPGMYTVNRSGAPGSGAVFSLRGINSIYANTQPLVVVDGVPMVSQGLFNSNLAGYDYNPLLAVNPFDISKVNVVKDPSITTAYGSKASNGVIFIETLDPAATSTSIEIDYRNGFSLKPEKQIPVMNANQHRTLVSEVLFSSPLLEEEIVDLYPNMFLEETDQRFIDYQHNTNWQDFIFDNALYSNFNLNVKGGDGIARYGLSFGYTDANGVIKNTDYSGYNLRFVSMLNIFTWLKMDAGVSLNYSFGNMREAALVAETSPIMTSLSKSPLLNPFQYDYDGNELLTLSEVDELGVSNPLGALNNFVATNSNYNFITNIGFTATINKDMYVKTAFSLNYNVLKEEIYMPNRGMELYYNDEAYNVAKLSNNSLNSFYNNTYLNYSKVLDGDHKINSTSGVNLQVNDYQFDWGLTKNAHENDEYRMIQDGQNNLREIGGMNRKWNWMSFYEYVNYSFKDRYMLSAALSLDGSSRIGDNAANTINIGVPFGLFYSVGAGWRISEESFMDDMNWMEDLKLRVSYGVSGNDDIGEASATNYYNSIKFRETVGLYPATVPNDELTYETVSQLNVGLDFAAKGSRFRASIDYFMSNTDNMLIFSPIESFLGYDLRMENSGKMQNSGLELGAYYRVLEKGSFKWDIQATFSTIKNAVTEIEGNMMSYDIPGGEKVNMVNETANSFYGYIYEGVYSTQAEAEAAGLKNDRDMFYQAGDAKFRDISGPQGQPDSVINFYDKTVIGSPLPDFYGGLSTRFSYKRFALDIAVQFVYGNDIFNYVRYRNERMSNLDNQSTAVLNRWQYEGQITDIPRALFDDQMGNAAFSTRWIEDGSYARLKHICLSYKIPDEFIVFRNAEFYISVNNLLTLSRYLGYYPEFSYSHSQMYQGVDYGLTPQSQQFMAGIKLGL